MKINRITELLSIRFPSLQAPMGRTAPPRLAAAVANAGGLGMLGTSWDAPGVLREEIRATRALTDGPFAINLAMSWDQHAGLEIAPYAGQSVGLIEDLPPVASVMTEMARAFARAA